MTNNERLENIKADIENNCKKEYEFITQILYEDSLWLIQQADRVQELERQLENQKRHKMTYRKMAKEYHGENKLYCEAIKQAIGLFNYDESAEGMKVLREALEQTI